ELRVAGCGLRVAGCGLWGYGLRVVGCGLWGCGLRVVGVDVRRLALGDSRLARRVFGPKGLENLAQALAWVGATKTLIDL
ncbi:MAG TPA: hypothetical protein VE242_13560, partial [Chthoniobacterales bacterium]|nr:hypothetical protein [Chthoniobacterales bacterium]